MTREPTEAEIEAALAAEEERYAAYWGGCGPDWEAAAAADDVRERRQQALSVTSDTMVTVISFGYLHGPAPDAHATVDVRHHFKDPHVDPALRHLTAEDAPVVRAVLGTSGITALVGSVTATARAFLAGPCHGPLMIAIGCAGGRHRSAVIASEVCRLLSAGGIPVTLEHRDIRRPVVVREAS